MVARLVTEDRTKQLGQIVKADAEFISLVRHAANRQGFRIMKDDKDDDLTVQSVLIPEGTELAEIAKTDGYSWLLSIPTTATVRGNYREHVCMDRDKFNESTLCFIKLGETGAVSIAGKLLQEKTDKKITINGQQVAGGSTDTEILIKTELNDFAAVAAAALKQQSLSKDDKAETILRSFDALGQRLVLWLDQGFDKPVGAEKQEDTPKSDSGGMETMFKNKEEMGEFIGTIIDARLKEHKLIGKEDPPTKDAKKSDTGTQLSGEITAALKDVTDQLAAMDAKINAVTEKQDKLTNNLGPGGRSTAVDPERLKQVQKWESFPAGVPKEERSGIFRGTLFNWDQLTKAIPTAKQ